MAHTYTNLLYHVVFSTKDRLPCIDDQLRPRLCAYMGGIVRDISGIALIVNGTADHTHMLLVLPATLAIADAMRLVKTNSSRWVHEEWPQHQTFGWQIGYAAFTVSESNRDSVIRYIADQEEHHRKKTFQEELIALLEKHGIEYDPRYVWA